LSKEQFGFKSNSSTDKTIFKLLSEILNALNNKLTTGRIFCDLEKAFDWVDHNKLQYYGITALIYTLIQSYLTGRYQCVVINSKISTYNMYSKRGINSKSVPQGFMLGLLLFLIYINDPPITSNDNATPILFASDTSIFITF
jgi:hypothetical protein